MEDFTHGFIEELIEKFIAYIETHFIKKEKAHDYCEVDLKDLSKEIKGLLGLLNSKDYLLIREGEKIYLKKRKK